MESPIPNVYSYSQIQYDNPLSTFHKINGACVGIYTLVSLYGLNQNTLTSVYLSIDRNLIKFNSDQCNYKLVDSEIYIGGINI